jgi:GT2 family glycosyltransferase
MSVSPGIPAVGGPAAPFASDLPRVGVVVISQGTRPAELTRCLGGILAQRGVELDVVCIGNGWEPVGLPSVVRRLGIERNIGIPAARNLGAGHVKGELIFFCDDDAWLADANLLAHVADRFARRQQLGAVQPRITAPDGRTLRRWVPRARVGDPQRPGPAFNLAEGVTVLRRSAFEQLGGWAAEFFYGHEGIDLAWRLWAHGWEVFYAGDLEAHHPITDVTRHAAYYRFNARNRVWSARRNLPAPLLVLYLGLWAAVTSARLLRTPTDLRTWWSGFREGCREPAGPRRPMSWRTVLRLARLGQPPVI